MASLWFQEAAKQHALGALDLIGDDLRVLLVMSNTTAGAELDADSLADITDLDEYDGTGYARVAMAGRALVEVVDPKIMLKMTADPTVFPDLGPGSRQAAAAIIYRHTGTPSTELPIVIYTNAGFPFTGTGSDATVNWSPNGVVRFKRP